MAEAKRDQNYVTTLIGVSSADGITPVTVYVDPVTHRLLVNSAAGGTGTVTSVSIVTANGISGSVATATTTPAITLTLGAITPTSVNGPTISATTGTLTITSAKTFSVTNTLTLSGTDGSTLNIGTGGTLGSNAYTSTAYAPLASPTFTGTVTIPTPFTIGAVSMTTTATRLNYLTSAGGTTGTTSSNIVFSASPTFTGKASFAATSGTHTNDTDGTTVTFDMNVSNYHRVTLGGNRTLAVSNTTAGQAFTILLKQDTTGSRTVTWFSGILWPGGTVPTLTTTANKTDVFTFYFDGTNYFGGTVGSNY